MKVLLSFISGLSFLFPLSGIAVDYPVITSVTTTNISEDEVNYEISQEIIDIGDDPTIQQTNSNINAKCGLAHKHYEGTGEFISFSGVVTDWNSDGRMTLAECAVANFKEHNGSKAIVWHKGILGMPECLAYVAQRDTLQNVWSQAIYPQGKCIIVPPGKDWCNISTPEIEINHGTLLVKAGEYVSDERLNVSCTAPMNIRIEFGSDTLKLAQGVTSKLSTPDASFDGMLEMNEGDNNITLRSTLTIEESADAGFVEGSTIVFLSYY